MTDEAKNGPSVAEVEALFSDDERFELSVAVNRQCDEFLEENLQEAAEAISQMMDSEDPRRRYHVVSAFLDRVLEMDPETVAPLYKKAFRDANESVRNVAFVWLANSIINEDVDIDRIVPVLKIAQEHADNLDLLSSDLGDYFVEDPDDDES